MPRFSDNAASDTVQIYFMNDVAGNRKQPEFDAIPVRLGDFSFHPTLQVNTNFDGNWLNRSDTADLQTGALAALPTLKAAFGTQLPAGLLQQIGALNLNPQLARRWDEEVDIDPSINGKGEWDGSSLSFQAAGHFYRYARLHRENRSEWHANIDGEVALGEKQNLTFTAGADSRAEVPGSNGTAVLDYFGFGPSIHTSPTITANANLTFGRVLAQATVAFTRDYYSTLHLRSADVLDGAGLAAAGLPTRVDLSQAYREDQAMQVIGNLTYNGPAETQYFVQSSYQFIQQLDPPRDSAGNAVHPFDSDTFGFLVGIAKSFDRIIVVQAGAGWQFHRYGDPYYQNTSRLNLQGAADWYPTPLLSFRVMAGQTYMSSAVYGVGDIAVRTLTVRADYEFRPNIEVWALFSSEWDKYPTDRGTQAASLPGAASIAPGSAVAMQSGNFEIDYRPNRLLGIGLNVGMHRRLSADPVVLGRFSALRFGLTITVRH